MPDRNSNSAVCPTDVPAMPGRLRAVSHSRHNNFDGLRLFFALLVLLSHGRAIFGLEFASPFFHQAELAVSGFFIISGFLISWSIDRSFTAKSYAIKRMARIYPLYAVVITVQLLVLAWFNTDENHLGEMLVYYASNMASLNFIKPWFGTMVSEPINGSLWTIKVELMFYAVIPVYIWFLKRYGLAWLALSFICAFAWRFGLEEHNIQLARQIPGSMAFFIAGIVSYFYGPQIIESLKNRQNAMLALIAAAALALAAAQNYYALRLGYILVLTIIIYALAFRLPPLHIPTDISYGVYLWHVPVFLTLRHVTGDSDPLLLYIGGSAAVLFIAWLSAHCVEIPCIKWAHRTAKKFS